MPLLPFLLQQNVEGLLNQKLRGSIWRFQHVLSLWFLFHAAITRSLNVEDHLQLVDERNIDSSEWLENPGLQVIETVEDGPTKRAEFGLTAKQLSTVEEDNDELLEIGGL